MNENSAGYDRIAGPPRVWQVVHVIGDLDLLGGLELDARLGRELAAHRGDGLVLDLSRVPFMDCAGLGAVLRARRRHGHRLRLRGVQPRVRWFLDLAQVTDVLPGCSPSRDPAGEARDEAEADQAVAVPDGVRPQPRRSPRARA